MWQKKKKHQFYNLIKYITTTTSQPTFRNATIYLSEIIVVCKKINVPLKYIGYFGKKKHRFSFRPIRNANRELTFKGLRSVVVVR